MLRRSNKRKNKSDKPIENRTTDNFYNDGGVPSKEQSYENTMSREEFIMHNEDAKKVYEDIMKLRKSVEGLKASGRSLETQAVFSAEPKSPAVEETEETIAAKKAILEQAKKDAQIKKAQQMEALRREQEIKQQQQRAQEAQKRAAMIEEEAEKKRLQAIEAEKNAKEVARKAALEAMEAERRAKEEAAARRKAEEMASAEEKAAFFDEKSKPVAVEAELERAKKELLSTQKIQEAKLGAISQTTERHTTSLAAKQHHILEQQQKLIQEQHEEVAAVLDDHKEQRIERLTKDVIERDMRKQKALEAKAAKLAKAQAEKEAKIARLLAEREAKQAKQLAEREAKQAKQLAEREAKQARLLAEKEEKKIREAKKKAERLRKAEERELIKKAKRDAEARAKLELMRLEAKSQADAEMGGGIVNVQGMAINTEIKDVPHFGLRDLFNLKTKQERKAETEKEKRKLERQRKERAEEARALVDMSWRQRVINFEKTVFAKKFGQFKTYCDKHKVALLTAFAIVLTVAVAGAGVVNHYTAYAYSYNGKELGYVKEKDEVLQITDLVQNALTEDKQVDVVIDTKKDINFHMVWTGSDVESDTSEDVLKKLTYMGDLNVKATGIFINDKKVGAVESDAVAAEVIQEIKGKYVSGIEDSTVEEAVFIEDFEARQSNTSLENVSTKEEMVEKLCTPVKKETLHTVVAEESLEDIAKLYSMSKKQLLKDNPNVNEKNLKAGDKIIIKQEAPILTVRITEKVSYDKVIEHKVTKKDSKEIYQGYTETKQKGRDGLNEVTSRIVLVNGEQIEENILEANVKKEAIEEIILVGVKKRPPSVGSGKYIWPLEKGKYVFTSAFAWRWGSFHSGIDLGIPEGNKIMAADGGIVTEAGYSGGYGYLVIIDHQNGMESRYAHCSSLLVSEGDKVFQGMEIAKSGNTGYSTGPHLHFEIRVNGVAKDPMNYLP